MIQLKKIQTNLMIKEMKVVT